MKLARVLAWLIGAAVVVWLLSMTLREVGGGFRVGNIRINASKNEVNLRPFVDKAQSFRNLSSPVRAIRRSAQGYLFIDVLGNVAVFVPFGAVLATATWLTWPMRRRSWSTLLRVIGAGLLLSLFIELAQLAIPGRVTDIDDVILNTLGTAVGALFAWGLLSLSAKQDVTTKTPRH